MRLSLIILTIAIGGSASCAARPAAVALDQVPAPVTAAAVAALPGFTTTDATSETEDGGISYNLRGTVAGQKAKIEIEVAADGQTTVEETEKMVALDQVPAAISDAALKAAPGFQVTKAECEVKKGKVEWTLEGTVADKKIEVEVKADGSTEIESDDGDHECHGDKGRKD